MYSTDCTDSNVLRTRTNVILPRRAKNKRVLIFEVCAHVCLGTFVHWADHHWHFGGMRPH